MWASYFNGVCLFSSKNGNRERARTIDVFGIPSTCATRSILEKNQTIYGVVVLREGGKKPGLTEGCLFFVVSRP